MKDSSLSIDFEYTHNNPQIQVLQCPPGPKGDVHPGPQSQLQPAEFLDYLRLQELFVNPQLPGPHVRGLDVRRDFTAFQLMTILEENSHTIVIIKHDPLVYEDTREMAEYVSQAMREGSKDAAILLYASGAGPYFDELAKNADRVFCLDEGPIAEARVVAKAIPRTQRSQSMLEAFP